MIVPGKVIWIREIQHNLHLFDSATETIETIHEFWKQDRQEVNSRDHEKSREDQAQAKIKVSAW